LELLLELHYTYIVTQAHKMAVCMVRMSILLLGLFFAASLLQIVAKPVHASELCQNSFAGGVYLDQNNNHERDSTELYLPGQVTIWDASGNLAAYIQSADGLFLSTLLACGSYTLQHDCTAVGEIVITESMGQELKEFPKLLQLFLPLVAR
jgi:hypothetical protein